MHRKISMNDHAADIVKCFMSGTATALAMLTSFQQEIEWWLRIASLTGAIAVSVFTIWSIWKKNRTP